VYVPPVYREVARVVECRPAGCDVVTVPVKQIVFEERMKPACYTPKRTACRSRTDEVLVQTSPGCDVWKPVDCGCGDEACFQHVKTPPTYKLCDKTVTEGGVAYCAFTPPEYEIVAKTVTSCEKKSVYRPGDYRVVADRGSSRRAATSGAAGRTARSPAPRAARAAPPGHAAPVRSPALRPGRLGALRRLTHASTAGRRPRSPGPSSSKARATARPASARGRAG
jgi:hypothetical protein